MFSDIGSMPYINSDVEIIEHEYVNSDGYTQRPSLHPQLFSHYNLNDIHSFEFCMDGYIQPIQEQIEGEDMYKNAMKDLDHLNMMPIEERKETLKKREDDHWAIFCYIKFLADLNKNNNEFLKSFCNNPNAFKINKQLMLSAKWKYAQDGEHMDDYNNVVNKMKYLEYLSKSTVQRLKNYINSQEYDGHTYSNNTGSIIKLN